MKSLEQILSASRHDHGHPAFDIGDHIRVFVKIREGEKQRIQVFEGDVIARQGKGVASTFTVRKISSGVGVERIFPFYSTMIEKIEIGRTGRVRRAKLYYLRDLKGKSAKIRGKEQE